MKLCVVDTDKIAAGFRLEANIGTLEIPDGENMAQISSGEATHNQRNPLVNDTACWMVQWNAPPDNSEDGLFTFRANAVNNDFTPGGDHGGYFTQISTAVLPVELSYWKAYHADGKNILEWSTSSEINHDRWEVLKSKDGYNWNRMGLVKGRGNGVQHNDYTFTDDLNIAGKLFYRLNQIDLDGSSTLSDIRIISNYQDWKIPTMVQIGDKIKIPDGSFIRIFNLHGQLMSSVESEEIRVPDLPSGIYILMTLFGSQRIYITRS
jgi:hypothetical protein